MIVSTIAFVSAVVIVATCIVRQRIESAKRFREIMARPDRSITEEKLRTNLRSTWIFEKVFGCYFAVGTWFGNCFSPAVVLLWHGMSKPLSSHHRMSDERLAKFSDRMRERYEKAYAERIAEPETFSHAAWAVLTIRFDSMETRIYWRGWFRFDWNSDHIAYRWGKHHSPECGQHFPEYWAYRGLLGSHMLV